MAHVGSAPAPHRTSHPRPHLAAARAAAPRAASAAALALALCAGAAGVAAADPAAPAGPSAPAPPARAAAPGHGPGAPSAAIPSHRFTRAAHRSPAQLAFHYGLLQPLLLRGFNAAIDLRVGRVIASYSHGQGLNFGRAPGALTAAEDAAGLRVIAPISTGGGIGLTIVDELYAMVDLKVHRFEASAGGPIARYTTVTAGVEVGWRFFVWRGLHVTPVVRYWPTLWDSAPEGGVAVMTAAGEPLRHAPMQQGASGLFANVLLGWAFDL
jgi:hypothetical protein